jgi:hypothetical protein
MKFQNIINSRSLNYYARSAGIPCVTEYPGLGDFLFGLLPSDFIHLPASQRILEIIL